MGLRRRPAAVLAPLKFSFATPLASGPRALLDIEMLTWAGVALLVVGLGFAVLLLPVLRIGEDHLTIAVPLGFVSPARARAFIEALIATRRKAIESRT